MRLQESRLDRTMRAETPKRRISNHHLWTAHQQAHHGETISRGLTGRAELQGTAAIRPSCNAGSIALM